MVIIRCMVASLTFKIVTNFPRNCPGSLAISSWTLWTTFGVFSLEWLFLNGFEIFFGLLQSLIFSENFITVNLGYLKNSIISAGVRPMRRLSIIAALQLYSMFDLDCSAILRLCSFRTLAAFSGFNS